jgi:hypothetical protein
MDKITKLSRILHGAQKKSHLFDPINLMFKYAIVYISEPSTKLSYVNHIITIQKPDWSQPISRYYDDRDDIHLILKALIEIINRYHTEYINYIPDESESNSESEKSIKSRNSSENKDDSVFDPENLLETNMDHLYDKDQIDVLSEELKKSLEESEHNIKRIKNRFYKSEQIKKLLEYMIKGLDIIQKYYEDKYGDGMFVPGIQYMMNLLHDGLHDKIPLHKLPSKYRTPDKISIININEILKLWDNKKIQKLLNLLRDAEKYIETTMNQSSIEWNEALSISETRQILDGYISSMMPTLNDMDKKFQQIVESSIA